MPRATSRRRCGLARAGRSGARFSLMNGAVIGRNRAETDARKDAIAERRDDPDFEPPAS